MAKRVSAEQLAILREAFLRGDAGTAVAVVAKVTVGTAYAKFILFRSQGLVRGKVPRVRPRPRRLPGLPVYRGPDWIGKRA